LFTTSAISFLHELAGARFMEAVFPLAGAMLVLLEVIAALSEKTKRYLPIGGSHIAQLAIVLGLAFVIYEVMSVMYNDGPK
jgi:hypothetical protein